MNFSKQRPRRPMLLAIMLGIVAVLGCTHLKELIGWGPKRPTVHLKDVVVSKASLKEVQLGVVLKVFNPNHFDLRLSKLIYRASAFETEFASGEYPDQIIIAPEETLDVTLPLTLDWQRTAALLEKFLNNPQKAKVLLNATADFGTPLGDISLTFQEEKAVRTP